MMPRNIHQLTATLAVAAAAALLYPHGTSATAATTAATRCPAGYREYYEPLKNRAKCERREKKTCARPGWPFPFLRHGHYPACKGPPETGYLAAQCPAGLKEESLTSWWCADRKYLTCPEGFAYQPGQGICMKSEDPVCPDGYDKYLAIPGTDQCCKTQATASGVKCKPGSGTAVVCNRGTLAKDKKEPAPGLPKLVDRCHIAQDAVLR